jgi:hypothetical protein
MPQRLAALDRPRTAARVVQPAMVAGCAKTRPTFTDHFDALFDSVHRLSDSPPHAMKDHAKAKR